MNGRMNRRFGEHRARHRRGRIGALIGVAVLALATVNTTPVAAAVAPNDFALVATPSALTIGSGATKAIRISVKRGAKFRSPLTFSVQNPFSGVSADLTKVTAKGSTLIIGTDTTVASQTGQVQINATGGGVTRSVVIAVTIAGKGAPQTVAAVPPPPVPAPAPAQTAPPSAPTTAVITTPPTAASAPKPTTLKTTPPTNPGTTQPSADTVALSDILIQQRTSKTDSKFEVAISQQDGSVKVMPTNLQPSRLHSWVIGDVNGDGFDDFIGNEYTGIDSCVMGYRVWFRTSSTTFQQGPPNSFGSSCFFRLINGTYYDNTEGFGAGDINGDGKLDIVSLEGSDSYDADDYPKWRINLGIGDGTGKFVWSVMKDQLVAAPLVLRLIDNNGDGKAEAWFFVADDERGKLVNFWTGYEFDAALKPTYKISFKSPKPGLVVSEDFNGNGKKGLLADAGGNRWSLVGVAGGPFELPGDGDALIGTGKFNGDANTDLVTLESVPGSNILNFYVRNSDGGTRPTFSAKRLLIQQYPDVGKAMVGNFG
jgi:FG-GAP-like repeat